MKVCQTHGSDGIILTAITPTAQQYLCNPITTRWGTELDYSLAGASASLSVHGAVNPISALGNEDTVRSPFPFLVTRGIVRGVLRSKAAFARKELLEMPRPTRRMATGLMTSVQALGRRPRHDTGMNP
jgi:hypothetical protein